MSVVDIFRALLHGEASLNRKREQLCESPEFDIWLLFLLLDNTQCGVITSDGFVQLYGELVHGKRLSMSDAALLFRRYDVEVNGSIGFVNLCRAFAPRFWNVEEKKLQARQELMRRSDMHQVTSFEAAWSLIGENVRSTLGKYLEEEVEFCVGLNRMRQQLEESNVNLLEVFHQLDRNDNGFIGRDELADYLAENGVQASVEDLAMAFWRFDADNDNRVNYIEFSDGFMPIDGEDSAVSFKSRVAMVSQHTSPVTSSRQTFSPSRNNAQPRSQRAPLPSSPKPSSSSSAALRQPSFSSSAPPPASTPVSRQSNHSRLSSVHEGVPDYSDFSNHNRHNNNNNTVTTRLADNQIVAVTPTRINGVSSVVISFPSHQEAAAMDHGGSLLSVAPQLQQHPREVEDDGGLAFDDFSQDFSAIKLNNDENPDASHIFRNSRRPGHSTQASKAMLTMNDLMSPSKRHSRASSSVTFQQQDTKQILRSDEKGNDAATQDSSHTRDKLSESVYKEQSALADLYREQPLFLAGSSAQRTHASALLRELSDSANRVALAESERAALHAALHCMIRIQFQVEVVMNAFWKTHPEVRSSGVGVFEAVLQGSCDRTQSGYDSRMGHVLFGDDVLGFIEDTVTPEHVKQWLRQIVTAGSSLRLTSRAEPGASREDVATYFSDPQAALEENDIKSSTQYSRRQPQINQEILRGLIVQLVVLESFAEQVRNNLTRRHKFRFLPCFTQIDHNNNGICSADEILEYLNDLDGSRNGLDSSSYSSLKNRANPSSSASSQQMEARSPMSSSVSHGKRSVRKARGLRDHLQRKRLAQTATDIPSPMASANNRSSRTNSRRAQPMQYDEESVSLLLRRFKCTNDRLSYSNFITALLPTN